MFYISSKNNGKFEVTDTNDNVKEWYTEQQIRKIISDNQVVIYGVTPLCIGVTTPVVEILKKTQTGVPIRIKLSNNTGFKQCIYMGRDFGTFDFFDGEGVNGFFTLSANWFIKQKDEIRIDLDNNDTFKVASLVKLSKQMGY